jgi:hypothetical protein
MTESKYSWVSHLEWLVMMVTLIGGFYTIDEKIDRQSSRTDRLYEMFCDMQKQLKDEIISLNKVQLDFIKENIK